MITHSIQSTYIYIYIHTYIHTYKLSKCEFEKLVWMILSFSGGCSQMTAKRTGISREKRYHNVSYSQFWPLVLGPSWVLVSCQLIRQQHVKTPFCLSCLQKSGGAAPHNEKILYMAKWWGLSTCIHTYIGSYMLSYMHDHACIHASMLQGPWHDAVSPAEGAVAIKSLWKSDVFLKLTTWSGSLIWWLLMVHDESWCLMEYDRSWGFL